MANAKTKMTIGQLEKKMLKKYPAKNACEWDQTGLTVGNRTEKITKVAVALDVTPEAIHVAKKSGANLLVTHHPSFIEAPESFGPGDKVYEAVFNHINLMNFHTAMDLSEAGASTLPKMLKLKDTKKMAGFARVCTVNNITFKQLVSKCTKTFDRPPRVWGNFTKKLKTVLTASGSVDVASIDIDFDCLICGEIKYHAALDLAQAGKCVIELGHDVSELPFVDLLCKDLISCGITKKDIIRVDQTHNWTTPASVN